VFNGFGSVDVRGMGNEGFLKLFRYTRSDEL
jgi:hypothetical protein